MNVHWNIQWNFSNVDTYSMKPGYVIMCECSVYLASRSSPPSINLEPAQTCIEKLVRDTTKWARSTRQLGNGVTVLISAFLICYSFGTSLRSWESWQIIKVAARNWERDWNRWLWITCRRQGMFHKYFGSVDTERMYPTCSNTHMVYFGMAICVL